eukprot:753955-Hanusia_phi.AAC.4
MPFRSFSRLLYPLPLPLTSSSLEKAMQSASTLVLHPADQILLGLVQRRTRLNCPDRPYCHEELAEACLTWEHTRVSSNAAQSDCQSITTPVTFGNAWKDL